MAVPEWRCQIAQAQSIRGGVVLDASGIGIEPVKAAAGSDVNMTVEVFSDA